MNIIEITAIIRIGQKAIVHNVSLPLLEVDIDDFVYSFFKLFVIWGSPRFDIDLLLQQLREMFQSSFIQERVRLFMPEDNLHLFPR